MIKLKDLLLESDVPAILIPRKIEDRKARYNQMTQREVNNLINKYNANKSVGDLDLSAPFDEDIYADDDWNYNTSELSLDGEFIIPYTLKRVGGSLDLSYSKVTKLPDDLTFKDYGVLNISDCKKLKELPKGLNVYRIDAENSSLMEIPDDLQCTYLSLQHTKVRQLPLFKNLIEDIDLEGCTYFKTLPVGFTAGKVLIQESNSFVSVPNNVKIEELVVNECKRFTSIGSNCSIERLFIGYSCPNFTTLPTDIKANLVSLPYIHTPLRINLFSKYKTKPKVLKALTQMYPNVKEFQLG
mgnify:FL=1